MKKPSERIFEIFENYDAATKASANGLFAAILSYLDEQHEAQRIEIPAGIMMTNNTTSEFRSYPPLTVQTPLNTTTISSQVAAQPEEKG